LNATVIPNGFDTAVYFQYGPTLSYGSATLLTNLTAGTNPVAVSFSVGLAPASTYYYRVVGSNSVGSVNGLVLSFATPAYSATNVVTTLNDGGPGSLVDVRTTGGFVRGVGGAGTVHHVAWSVADDAAQLVVRERVHTAGLNPTPVIDRNYFHSVYFHEPGGVLFELATDGPGFAVDEDAAHLGETLVLPPWLEPRRKEIEASLPRIALPHQTPTAAAPAP